MLKDLVVRVRSRNLPAEGGRARRLPADRNQPVRSVALGDSTVYGVGASGPKYTYASRLHARLREVYPAAVLTNLGVSGDGGGARGAGPPKRRSPPRLPASSS